MYAEMVAFDTSRKRQEAKREAAAAAYPLPVKPTAQITAKKPSNAVDVEKNGATIEQLTCPKCRRKGMIIRTNGLDDAKFYGCQNFNTFTRCKGAYSWNKGQSILGGAGPAVGSAFRQ